MLPANFSVIALQEIWSINKMYELTGYSNLVYNTRDMGIEPNPNCGGGVGFFVKSNFEYEVLEEESVYLGRLRIHLDKDQNGQMYIQNYW
jgi:hypothetical protein